MSDSSLPLVSVVIPAFNPPAELFKSCIDSVTSQSYENLEIIVVDDGSQRDYASLIDRITAGDIRVHIVRQENAGEGGARNTGIENVNGKYVMFVDADDGLAPGWIETAVRLAAEDDSDIVMGKVMQVPIVPPPNENRGCGAVDSKAFSEYDFWQLQRDFLLISSSLLPGLDYLDPGVCSKLVRRDCIGDLRFPAGIKLSSDQVFNHGMLRRAKRYVVTNKLAYFYVSNGDSVSHIYNPDAAPTMMKSMSLIKPLLIDNEEVKQAFCFRVLLEIGNAIQFAAFSEKCSMGFRERARIIREISGEPLLQEVLAEMDILKLPERSWCIKAFLLRHHLGALYAIIKGATD